ncbi:P-loop NTPase [Salmonella enterica]|nr:chromosome partitioning protein ParA [Salmonella enterica]EHA9546193.1 P-loop NTPase [Salmonella enterica subsp. enterica serovar Braenderup]EHP7123065.1 P-loop NTPase [Salmonella enterica subsp. enterica serovar Thompson]EBH4941574.1 chromosome partitioning protein ParA [Salmonella enterica]ECK3278498.1 AAA family ATPase [Salmonella enterica]
MTGRITLVGGNKGGGGKSTIASNVATGFALAGRDTCILDADIQGSTTLWNSFRIERNIEPKITVMQGKGNIAPLLLDLAERYQEVVVDVAGRNSKEFLAAGGVADVIISPALSSQFDLATLEELQEQFGRWKLVNPELELYLYHSRANTHAGVRKKERKEFLQYLDYYPEFKVLDSIIFERTPFREVIPQGLGILETTYRDAAQARQEIKDLMKEVFNVVY